MYTTAEILLTTKQVELIEKKEFTAIAFNLYNEIFIVYIISIASLDLIHLFYKAPRASLKVDEALTVILFKYAHFTNSFSLILKAKFLKHIWVNNHVIEFINDKRPFYKLIYNPKLIELETLKIYIETNLAINFRKPSNSLTSALIFLM